MDRRRNRHQKSEPYSKLDEFPEDFDDLYFYNHVVDQDSKIPVLRSIVYKKIKNCIIDRVAGYENDISTEDDFEVVFEPNEFTKFQWGVIREELLDRGFDAKFTFSETEDITSMIVPIKRKVDLHETLEDRLEEYDSSSEYSSDEDDSKETS